MKKANVVKSVLSLWVLGSLSSAVHANSVTFDFLHPDGIGSSYADAISLNTLNSVLDKNGSSVGFTTATLGVDVNNQIAAFELTAAGLKITVNSTTPKFAVGVPFDTTGASAGNSVGISIQLAEDSVAGQIDANYETLGVGWGASTSTWVKTISGAKIWSSAGTPYVSGQSGNSNGIDLANPNTSHPAGAVWSGASSGDDANFYLRANGAIYTANPVSDTLGALNNPESYGFLYGDRNGGPGYELTVEAITFYGPNFISPIPEPTVGLFLLSGSAFIWMTRRSLRK